VRPIHADTRLQPTRLQHQRTHGRDVIQIQPTPNPRPPNPHTPRIGISDHHTPQQIPHHRSVHIDHCCCVARAAHIMGKRIRHGDHRRRSHPLHESIHNRPVRLRHASQPSRAVPIPPALSPVDPTRAASVDRPLTPAALLHTTSPQVGTGPILIEPRPGYGPTRARSCAGWCPPTDTVRASAGAACRAGRHGPRVHLPGAACRRRDPRA
jgi:hypothetical protein